MSDEEIVTTGTVTDESHADETVETEGDSTEETAEGTEETTEEATEDESGQPKKLTAQERVQQAVNEARAAKEEARLARERADAIEQQFKEAEARRQVVEKPYVELDMNKVAEKIAYLEDAAAEARLEGSVEGRLKARQLLREAEAIEAAVQANAEAKERFEKEQAESSKLAEYDRQQVESFDRAAEFYRNEMKIPPEVWKAGGDWIAEQMAKDKVLQAEFRDRVKHQGAISTIKWLHSMATEGLKQSQQVTEKKVEAKKKVPSASGSSGSTATAQVRPGMDINDFVRIRNEQERARIYG